MGTLAATPSAAEPTPVSSTPAPGWGPLTRVTFRFAFAYWILYSLPVILAFPAQLVSLAVTQAGAALAAGEWLAQGMQYLGYPSYGLQQATNWFAPRVSRALLGVEVEPPTNFTGSGDRLFNYCTCFAYLVVAAAATLAWTAASELWRRRRTHRRPNYDRLHAALRLVVRFHLMYQLVVYGAMKVWCAQFPPITDGQLDAKYGDSSPMGLLWRFMQFSQPYTAATGVVEFTCGLLLISRRTTLLGSLCALGATLQVFLLNMCYDVPVKLMSGQLVLMALTLIAPDARRLFSFFVLGRPTGPCPLTPIFGGWRRLDRAAVVLRTLAFAGFAALMLHQSYKEAVTRGIWAPENPAVGRWVGREFVRDGQSLPFPEQPADAPPRQISPSKWQGGPGIPAVVRVAVARSLVTLMFEDGSGVSYRNASPDVSEFVLVKAQGGGPVGRLRVTFPEPDVMVLEGPLDEQELRMTLGRVAAPAKEYPLRTRGFHWVQDVPFNR